MNSPLPARLFILGMPRPGGSKTPNVVRKHGEIVMVPTKSGGTRPLITMRDDAKGNAEWKRLVKKGAKRSGLFAEPHTGPLRVHFTFYMPRPKSHYVGGDPARGIKPRFALAEHIVRPDAIKLARSTEDALTGVAWRDDAQSFQVMTHKRYVREGEEPGVLVEIMGPMQ